MSCSLVAVMSLLVALCLAIGASAAQVLVVMPSQGYLRLDGGTLVRVGSYLSETAVPSLAMLGAGFKLTVATPQGNKPPLDPASNASSYFDNETQYSSALAFWNTFASLQDPLNLAALAPEDPDAPWNATTPLLETFDALFIPGGHAPIIDLFSSTAVGRIVMHFAQRKKPIGSICHGPLALAAASLLDVPWPFRGMNMTVFSTAEEKVAEEKKWNGRKLGFYPPDALREVGGLLHEGPLFESHVVHDRFLVTGQNPQSADALGAALVSLILAAIE